MKARYLLPILILMLMAVTLLNSCELRNAPGKAPESGEDAPTEIPAAVETGSKDIALGDFVITAGDGSVSFDMINGSFGDARSVSGGTCQTLDYELGGVKGYINACVSDLAVFYGRADVSLEEADGLPVWYIYCDSGLGSFSTARGAVRGMTVESVKTLYPSIKWEDYNCGYVELEYGGWRYRIYFRFENDLLTEIDLSKENADGMGAGLSVPGGETAAATAQVELDDNDRGYADNGDGTITYKDYNLGLKLTYPENMTMNETLLDSAAVLESPEGGYLTVRNVTEAYWAFTGSNRKFVMEYISETAVPDIKTLYGVGAADYEMNAENSDSDTTLAVGEVTVTDENGGTVLIRCVLQKLTFSDGEAYILARTQYAGNQENMDPLRSVGLGGTRIN